MNEHEKRALIQERVYKLLDRGAITHEKFERLLMAIPSTPAEQLDASLLVLEQLTLLDPEYLREHSRRVDAGRKLLHELVDQLGLSPEAAVIAHENAEMQPDPVRMEEFIQLMQDEEERASFIDDIEKIAKMPSWARKVHPAAHPGMDNVTTGLVGWLIEHSFVRPAVIAITLVEDEDGDELFQMIDEDGDPRFEAPVEELRYNFTELFDCAELTPEERMLAEFAFRQRFGTPLNAAEETALLN